MNHSFSNVPKAEINRSNFDRSHGLKTAIQASYLYPVFIDEVLPGDTIKLQPSWFARLATQRVPIMDNVLLKMEYFFVPNRLIWDDWQAFCGERDNPADYESDVPPEMPFINAPAQGGFPQETIYDYFGVPIGVTGIKIQALPLRAYNLIWNEWYRDQNLQDSVPVNTTSTPELWNEYVLLKRCKRHDYFTSCLPWPQKGVGIEIPLGDTAPVYGTGKTLNLTWDTDGSNNLVTGGLLGFTHNGSAYDALGVAVDLYDHDIGDTGNYPAQDLDTRGIGVARKEDGESGMYADLTDATAATINTLRQAFQLQKMLEKDARGGTRYIEILKSHFGISVPDYRLQRPEFLGSMSSKINSNVVAQQSASVSGTTPQANLAAFSTTAGDGIISKSFVEHGFVIGLCSVIGDITYQDGIHKMWSREFREDYMWPTLAHLGEQAVLNQEIYAQGTSDDTEVFGYQERYAEYRYKPSIVTGAMRSKNSQSLEAWHLAADFQSLPSLNASFIEDQTPLTRSLAVQGDTQVLIDIYYSYMHARPLPVYSVPGLIDHF